MSERITPQMLEYYERAKGYAVNAIHSGVGWYQFEDAMRTAVIDAALEISGGIRSKAARLLGIHRNSLARYL